MSIIEVLRTVRKPVKPRFKRGFKRPKFFGLSTNTSSKCCIGLLHGAVKAEHSILQLLRQFAIEFTESFSLSRIARTKSELKPAKFHLKSCTLSRQGIVGSP